MDSLVFYTEIRIFLTILIVIFISALSREVFNKRKKIKPFIVLSNSLVLGFITYGVANKIISIFDYQGLVAICALLGFVCIEVLGKLIEYAKSTNMTTFLIDVLEYVLRKLKGVK